MSGVWGAGKSVVGLTGDLVTFDWLDDDDADGFSDGFSNMLINRAGEFGASLFGAPTEEDPTGRGLFALPAVPEAFEAFETVGREVVREPLTTGVLTINQFGQDFKVNVDDVRKAYDLAQSTSFGQALITTLVGKDAFDPDSIEELLGTDWFRYASGTVDALTRWFTDPDVVLGKVGAAARMRHLVRPLSRGKGIQFNIENFFTRESSRLGASWRQVNDFIEETIAEADTTLQAAERIRKSPLFRGDTFGDSKAALLVMAPDATMRAKTARFLMGDMKQLKEAENYYERLKQGLEELGDLDSLGRKAKTGVLLDTMRDTATSMALQQHHTDNWLASLAKFALRNDDELVGTIDDQIALATRELNWIENLMVLGKSQATELRLTKTGEIADRIVRSNFYQHSPLTKPVRIVAKMRPHKLVNFDEAGFAQEQLARMMADARLPLDAIEDWRGRMGDPTLTTGDRFQLWIEAEQAAIKNILDDIGVDIGTEEARKLAARAVAGHNQARKVLNQRAFGPEGTDLMQWVDDATGEVNLVPRPLARSQTASEVAVPDMRLIRRAVWRYAQDGLLPTVGQKVGKGMSVATEVLDGISYYWKAAQLLRPGWMFRVVLMDEQLRMLAKFGTMATLGTSLQKLKGLGAGVAKELELKKAGRVNQVAGKAAFAGGAAGFVAGGPLGAAIGAAATGLGARGAAKWLSEMEQAGYMFTIQGMKFDPFDRNGLYADRLSQQRQIEEFLHPVEGAHYESIRGSWGTVDGTMPNYDQAWGRVVGRQVVQDPLWSQAIRGRTPQQMLDWLKTPDGRRYLDDIPWRSGEPKPLWKAGRWVDAEPEAWVQTLHDTARGFFNHDEDLMRIVTDAIEEGKNVDVAVSKALSELKDKTPNVTQLPKVHGELVAQLAGKSTLLRWMDDKIQSGFRYLGGLPTDHLSRQPTFALFFKRRMEALLDGVDAPRLSKKMLDSFERQARDYALSQTKKLMYDLAERSAFDDMVRFFIPFAPAGREVLTRWAGLAAENPAILARARQLWTAPNKVDGLIETDERGEEWLVFRIPQWAKGLVQHAPLFGNAIDDQGFIRMPKGAFSSIPILTGANAGESVFEGLFGFGPVVQMSVGRVLQERPDLEDALRFMAPYGIPQDAPDAFLPAWAKRARSAGLIPGLDKGFEDRSYRASFFNILKTRLVHQNLGIEDRVDFDDEHSRAAFIADVKRETDNLMKLRMFATYLMPVAPSFESPYKPLIDKYRTIRDNIDVINEERRNRGLQPTTTEAVFYEMYGEEFSALAQSTSKVNNGIPPTLAGFQAQSKHKKLLQRHPEIGALIVGNEGGGTLTRFSSAMYQRQLSTETFEGSGVMQREALSPDEFLTDEDASAGWRKYRKIVDLIEAERQKRGLPNLRVKAAEDLANAKRVAIEAIGAQHPAWVEDRAEFRTDVWQKRIEGFRAVLRDPQLRQRPDIELLGRYMKLRDSVVVELLRRKERGRAVSIDAEDNQDLRNAFDTAVAEMMRKSPTFIDLWSRWLENDPLSPDTLPRASEVA